MNRIRLASTFAATALAAVLLCGCSGEATTASTSAAVDGSAVATGGSWWGLVLGQVRAASGSSLQAIHDGTGWMLGKNEVKIEQIGGLEQVDGVPVARYRITVSGSDETFSSEIEGIECDELGIPSEQSQEKLAEAVAKIKALLDRLQS